MAPIAVVAAYKGVVLLALVAGLGHAAAMKALVLALPLAASPGAPQRAL